MTKGFIFVIVLVLVTIFQRPFHVCEKINDGSQLQDERSQSQDETESVEYRTDTDPLQSVETIPASLPLQPVPATLLEPFQHTQSNNKPSEYTRVEPESSILEDAKATSDVQSSTKSILSSLPVEHALKALTESTASQIVSEQTAFSQLDEQHTASSESHVLPPDISQEGLHVNPDDRSSSSKPDLVSDKPASTRTEESHVPEAQLDTSHTDAGNPDKPADELSQASSKAPTGTGDQTRAAPNPGEERTIDNSINNEDQIVEEFPSYSEWKQKELEKQKTQQKTVIPPTASVIKPKLRVDYASKNCGAKIIATNPEAENVQGVLSSSRDEYIINPCSAKKWFVLELCEPVQVKSVEIASLELFSSQPRAFTVLVSDRNPAKEWRQVGSFEATEDKSAQWFAVNDEQFVKFIKVELLNHYGNEHFCPVTLFRVFGIPMDDDDDDHEQAESANIDIVKDVLTDDDIEGDKESVKNLFTSAKDTVVKLVKTVLNVDLEHSDINKPKNKDHELPADVSDGNYSADGQLLPCDPAHQNEKEKKNIPTVIVPTGSIPQVPNEKQTDVSEKSIPASSDIGEQPLKTISEIQEKSRKRQTELPLVTKLADNEQVPSEKMKASRSLRESLSKCNKLESNVTSPHRLICSYVQTMLGNKITQTCCTDEKTSTLSTEIEMTSELWKTTSSIAIFTSDIPEFSRDLPGIGNKAASSDSIAESFLSEEKQQPSHSDFMSVLQSVQHSTSELFSHELNMNEDRDILSSESVTPDIASDTTLVKQAELPHNGLPVLESSIRCTDSSELISSSSPTPELSIAESQVIVQNTEAAVQGSLITKVMPTPTTIAVDSMEDGAYPQTVGASVEVHPGKLREEDMKENVPASEQANQEHKSSADFLAEKDINKAQNVTRPANDVNLKPVDLIQIPGLPVAKHRETAIMRLTNRIKTLELNVSLSSRFLDELSQRFKKQLDDMTKQMTNVSRTSEIKDEMQQEQLDFLESRVDNLTKWIFVLSENFDQLSNKLTDRQMVWASLEFLMLAVTCLVCLTRRSSTPVTPKLETSSAPSHSQSSGKARRSSDIGTVGHEVPVASIKKQSSETMLATSSVQNIGVVHKTDTPLSDTVSREGQKKKKRKKHKNLETKSSVDLVQDYKHDTQSSTQLSRCAGLLFGADAVNSLTGVTDEEHSQDTNTYEHGSSTTSLPCYSGPDSVESQPGRPDSSLSDTALHGMCPHHRKTFQPQPSRSVQSVTNGFSDTSDTKQDNPMEFSASYCLDRIESVSMIKTETKGYKKWVEWKKSLGFK
ncbi:SUN domain-containing ossification factor-like [Gigantopelta aegis]|uniref:SUN domain-containing ossification factor-like n=1 Tax=Gigantopelta aegis TaxID=1735272 RepID=UPI001B88D6B0|nr:SUN domain-containing ossification factor-like [Gigantopelta aegis]